MGDGEQQEGNIWEAVMEGSHHKLDNLVGIIDRNRLQIDGWVKDVMNVEPLEERYRAFGWEVIAIDGHDIQQVVDGLTKAKNVPTAGKPTVMICDTVKGKGVSFMENQAGWHGKTPNYEELVKALDELGLKQTIAYDALLKKATEYQKEVEAKLDAKMPHFSRDYWWNTAAVPKVKMEPTRKGFGQVAAEQRRRRADCVPRAGHFGIDHDQRLLCGQAGAQEPLDQHGHRRAVGNGSGRGTGAGREDSGVRDVWDVCGGAQSGPDSRVRLLRQFQCADCRSARRSFGWAGRRDAPGAGRPVRDVQPAEHGGVGAVRRNRNAQSDGLPAAGPRGAEVHPVRARSDADRDERRHAVCVWRGECIRLRRKAEKMVDAFDTVLASEYEDEHEDLAIIACGPMVPEAMRAAYILKQEFGYETRVVNIHTMKPIDADAIVRAAKETGIVVTAEEHQIGALAWRVSGIITESPELFGTPIITGAIGVKDRFGDSGAPWELIKEFEVSAEHIAQKAAELIALAKVKKEEEKLVGAH